MLLNLPVVYHGEFYNRKTREWTAHNFVKPDETFEIEHMDDSCQLAATKLNVPLLPDDLDVFWHDDSCWIRDTGLLAAHWPRCTEEPRTFNPLEKECLVDFARGAAVAEHSEGYVGIWGPTARDHWKKWAARTSRSPNPRTYSAFRDLTLEAERRRMHEFVKNLRLNDGVLYRRVETPSYSVNAEGGVTVAFGKKIGDFGSFCLGREDDLRAFLSGNFGPEAAACELVDTVLPQVFAWEDEEASFESAVDRVMKAARKYGSSIGDRGQARKRLEAAWHYCFPLDAVEGLRGFNLNLEDSCNHGGERRDCTRQDAFAREMTVFASALRSADANPMRYRSPRAIEQGREMRQIAGRISAAAARWQVRPISAEIELSTAPAL